MSNAAIVPEQIADATGTPAGTVRDTAQHLRAKRLMAPTKKGRGAPDYDTRSTINLLLGTLLAPSSRAAPETVERVSAFPLRHAPNGGVNKARAFGIGMLDRFTTALCALLDAFRSGTGPIGRVVVDIYATESALFSFMGEETDFVLFYGPEEESPPVMNFVRLDDRLFRSLAETLGPLPVAAVMPPPY